MPRPPRLLGALLTLVLLTSGVRGATQDDQARLLARLFDNYEPQIRPVFNQSLASTVSLKLHLLAILEVDEKRQTLKINTGIEIKWFDQNLSWNKDNFGGIASILTRQRRLWLPDIVAGNTVTTQTQLGYDNLLVRIDDVGRVTWNPYQILVTGCKIDITYYPFDAQMCNIVMETAMSTRAEISVKINETEPVDTSSYSANGLWRLAHTDAENIPDEVGKATATKTKIKFKLQLQRRRSYYVLNIVLPILLLSMTSSLTFALPSDAGEKMGLSITVLLAFAVYLTLITESMPDTSVQVSVLTVYLVVLLAVTASSVVLSVLVLRLHHAPPSAPPVTGCLATLTLSARAFLGMKKVEDGEEESRGDGGEEQAETPVQPLDNKAASRLTLEDITATHLDGLDQSKHDTQNRRRRDTALTRGREVKAVKCRTVAVTLDRLLFLGFTMTTVTCTATCLLALLIGASEQESATVKAVTRRDLDEGGRLS